MVRKVDGQDFDEMKQTDGYWFFIMIAFLSFMIAVILLLCGLNDAAIVAAISAVFFQLNAMDEKMK